MTNAVRCAAYCCYIVALIAIVAAARSCETEDYEDGRCVTLQKCPTINVSSFQPQLLHRERAKCATEDEQNLICCRVVPRPKIPRSYEDVKPLVRDHHELLPDHTVCGIDNADRIFNGNVTSLDQFPWLAVIKYIDEDENELFMCGGSLINKRYILTAAHCANRMIAEVRLGEWDLETNPDCVMYLDVERCAPPVLDVGIEKILIHKNYTRSQSKGGKIDLALLRLDREVTFNRYVAPICLPRTSEEARLSGDHVMLVAGWGITERYEASTKKLFVNIAHVEQDECRRIINDPLIKIDETLICALGENEKDACLGDSGGPLMEVKATALGALRYFVEGVVSTGLSCGSTEPGFYINVYKQIDWILSNMEP